MLYIIYNMHRTYIYIYYRLSYRETRCITHYKTIMDPNIKIRLDWRVRTVLVLFTGQFERQQQMDPNQQWSYQSKTEKKTREHIWSHLKISQPCEHQKQFLNIHSRQGIPRCAVPNVEKKPFCCFVANKKVWAWNRKLGDAIYKGE